MKIAIVAVAYNRTDSLRRLLVNLSNAYYPDDNIPLIISIDKSDTDEVEKFADDYQWSHGLKIVDKHQENLGLRNHMMSLGKWFDIYDALIVLEDDIVPSPSFYSYTEQTVAQYYSNPDIASISLYGYCINALTLLPFCPIKSEYDVFMMQWASSWGEVWMKNQWMAFHEWYLNNLKFCFDPSLPSNILGWKDSSWLKYHIRYIIENNKYTLYPYISLTTNYGDPGTHYKTSDTSFQVPILRGVKKVFSLPESIVDTARYNCYYENEDIFNLLGLSHDNLCVDLTGGQNNKLKRKYWLTTKKRNYKIIKSYGVSYRPIEMNLFENVEGHDIFLYDTTKIEKNHFNNSKIIARYNLYTYNIYQRLKGDILKNLISDMIESVKVKIKMMRK